MRVALSFLGCHRRGGVERVVFECARHLSSRGHAVTVFANEWDEDETGSIQYRYVPLRRRPLFARRASFLPECTKRLRASEYDVLNTHGCVCPVGGVLWVHSVHRVWLERSRALRAPFSAARLRQRLNPLHPILLRLEAQHLQEKNYHKVIALTPEVKADLHRCYGVAERDVEIIPNGFSPAEFSPERRAQRRDAMRARLGLKPEEVALLFVAHELERKGYQTILAALQRLKRPNVRLLVVGRASTRQVLRQAAERGLADRVIACGPTRDVAAFHAASDLFVLPTQYEAFCLAILEALGSGLPVITTRVPGAQDTIQPGVNGALIDDPRSGAQLAEALGPLLEGDLRDACSANAPGTVCDYRWPVVLARYEAVLAQCCR